MTQTITPGQTLTTRLACDYEIVLSVTILERKGQFVTVDVQGETKRCKVRISYDGSEYIMPMGTYSMAPIFKA